MVLVYAIGVLFKCNSKLLHFVDLVQGVQCEFGAENMKLVFKDQSILGLILIMKTTWSCNEGEMFLGEKTGCFYYGCCYKKKSLIVIVEGFEQQVEFCRQFGFHYTICNQWTYFFHQV